MIRVLFMGRKLVAARCLEYLLDKESVKVVGVLTDSHLSVSATANVAEKKGLPIFTFEEAMAAVENGKLHFDLGLSMLYWRKLKGALLAAPSMGTINFHPAPLPDFKGVGGYNLAILSGLSEWAATAHYVDEGIDTGPIIKVMRFPISSEFETAKSLEARSQHVLYELFLDTLEKVLSSKSKLESFPNKGGTYLTRAQLEEMKRVDPEKDDVGRKVRAFWFPPYDGAFVEINGQPFTLVDRSILEGLADPQSSSLFTPKAK